MLGKHHSSLYIEIISLAV